VKLALASSSVTQCVPTPGDVTYREAASCFPKDLTARNSLQCDCPSEVPQVFLHRVLLDSPPFLTTENFLICGAHPDSYPMGTRGSFPGGEAAGHGAASSAEVTNTWSCTTTSLYVLLIWHMISTRATLLFKPFVRNLRELNTSFCVNYGLQWADSNETDINHSMYIHTYIHTYIQCESSEERCETGAAHCKHERNL